MKTYFKHIVILVFMVTLPGLSAFSQVSINTNGDPPDNSAMLDVKSTEKGFLPPRLSFSQIEAITSPAEGLLIYCTDLKLPLFFNGSSWNKMDGKLANDNYSIGQQFEGGRIFYLFPSGIGGLICTEVNQSIEAEWGCYGLLITYADGTEIGTGAQNTARIVLRCPEVNRAAKICDDLVLNGYDDWFLPSKDELNEIYENQILLGGDFGGWYWWSSSEIDRYFVWTQNFESGNQVSLEKVYSNFRTRCIRKFY
jgi:hypothetical protein